jgi:hypothetical protein
VDTLDFNALAANFGGTGKIWTQADFNFDGVTDTLDFNALAANFGMALAATAPPAMLVPEPTGLFTTLAFVGIASARRKRRA